MVSLPPSPKILSLPGDPTITSSPDVPVICPGALTMIVAGKPLRHLRTRIHSGTLASDLNAAAPRRIGERLEEA